MVKNTALLLSIMLLTNCGAHDSEVSEPDFAQSNNGTMLIVTRGSDFKDKRRYCVTQVSEDETAKPLTAKVRMAKRK